MCMFGGGGGNSAPAPIQEPQAVKTPDTPKMMADTRKKSGGTGVGSSTLLTGTDGASKPPTLAKTSLLGQ